MTQCSSIRPLLPAWIEGELEPAQTRLVEDHLETCVSCRSTAEALGMIQEAGAAVATMAPPAGLTAHLTVSPCSRWLALLHRAADHELDSRALGRLLQHMEECATCRRAWDDLTLIHQVRRALIPPEGLATRCTARRRGRSSERTVFGVRTATAAAYVLAVLTTVLLGNPVSLARRDSGMVHEVRRAVVQRVNEAATNSRGDLRLILWRTWKWGEHQAEAIRELVAGPPNDVNPAQRTSQEQGEKQ